MPQETRLTQCYCDTHSIATSELLEESPILSEDQTRVVIFGRRSFPEPADVRPIDATDIVAQAVEDAWFEPDVVLSGGADGADNVGEAYAVERDIPVIVCDAGRRSDRHGLRKDASDAPYEVQEVTTYDGAESDPKSGNGAYHTRNCLMAALADYGIGLWDGRHNGGTWNMIKSCYAHGTQTKIVRTDQLTWS